MCVAAYCRVSSASDEQLVSYQNQVMHYKNYIRSNADYELIGIYADEGISGTDLRKREAFNQLMQAARDGQIDLIITKSLSRFGRNTLDCLNNIRELKDLGVDVYFEKEDVHTLHSEGEMLLTLIAAVAQNESLNQSENVKWGIRRQYERGHVQSIPAGKFLGYEKDRHGNLIIDDDQARTVRRIYQLFLDGFGTFQIAKILTEENVPMAYGGKEWCANHIKKVLINEKYKGDTLFQKTFNADFLTKRRVKNTGQLPQYYCKKTHPAIIDQNTWELVQLEFLRQQHFIMDHGMIKYHYHSQEIPLSGKIICGACGRVLLLRESNRTDSENIKYWKCAATVRTNKACSNYLKLDAAIVDMAIINAWNQLAQNRDSLKATHASSLINYRRERLMELFDEYGLVNEMPYELMLKVLDHIEVHQGFLEVIFLAGNIVRINLPSSPKPMPRWTHTRKTKSPMALRRMELGLTQVQLARKVMVSSKHINHIENRHQLPSHELALRINKVLGSKLWEG